jgi:ABC-type transport system involved in cytochrome bd biosynthesis fused ATPase/permease subunit
LLGRTPKELEALALQGEKLRASAVARERRTALLRLLPQLGTGLGGALVLFMAGHRGMEAGTAAAMLAMLAIMGLQMRDLAGAWDARSAWSIARSKLITVLARAEPPRETTARAAPVRLSVQGPQLSFDLPSGGVVRLTGPPGAGKTRLAEIIAGLARDPAISVRYDGGTVLPRVVHLGTPTPVLRGSLRRSLTLGVAPRPSSKAVTRIARDFGLGGLLSRLGSVRGRLDAPEVLSEGESLRIALARAALSCPDLVVIDNAAFRADPRAEALLSRLRAATAATMVVVGGRPKPGEMRILIDGLLGNAMA